MKTGYRDDMRNTGEFERCVGLVINSGTVTQQKGFYKGRSILREVQIQNFQQVSLQSGGKCPFWRLGQLQKFSVFLLIGQKENTLSLMGCRFVGTIGCGRPEFERAFQHIAGLHIDFAIDIEFGADRFALQPQKALDRSAILGIIAIIRAVGCGIRNFAI